MEKLNSQTVVDNINVPRFFYGTAWKEAATSDLTFQAMQAGFKAIDTANQRKHYFEEAVGLGLQNFLQLSKCRREDLFLQTKFTFAQGQDHRLPYKSSDSFTQQVADSFASSLVHLHTDYLDSYVLHGPYSHEGIGEEDIETWTAMENLYKQKKVKFLGVSNVSAEQLEALLESVKLKPRFVQNRCYARMGWDKAVRDICRAESIAYQGFSLLTANRAELNSDLVAGLATKYEKTVPQVAFRFSQQLEMICLTGTTDVRHMSEDLNIYDFELSSAEVSQIENIWAR